MRLTFVIYSLGSGGAERVLSIVANHFAERGDDVSIITLDDGSVPPFFEIDERVRRQPLGAAGDAVSVLARLSAGGRRVRALRRRIRSNQPDLVVSFMDRVNVITLAATIGMRTPAVVAERSDPAQQSLGGVFNLVRKLLYRRARAIVVQTNAAAAYFPPPLRESTLVVPNPVPAPRVKTPPGSRQGDTLLAMGRLSEEKRFDLLLEAFAAIADRFPDWNLTIWGEGDLRAALEKQRDDLGLAGRVRMPGRTKTPASEMQRADIFVLSSRYEGFPNVLLEAMACGTPPVSFDCPSGPRDIIQPGVNGVLVLPGNVAALAEAMADLMGDEPERRRLGANAEKVTDAFSLERVMAMWESIVDDRSRAHEELTGHVRNHRLFQRAQRPQA